MVCTGLDLAGILPALLRLTVDQAQCCPLNSCSLNEESFEWNFKSPQFKFNSSNREARFMRVWDVSIDITWNRVDLSVLLYSFQEWRSALPAWATPSKNPCLVSQRFRSSTFYSLRDGFLQRWGAEVGGIIAKKLREIKVSLGHDSCSLKKKKIHQTAMALPSFWSAGDYLGKLSYWQ